jgi:hypothetical protein
MTTPDWTVPPKSSAGDVAHAVVKAGISVATAGVGGEVFALLIRSPLQRRMQEWADRVEVRLKHLAERDREIVARLSDNDEFVSVFVSATQAAVRTHHEEKLRMLGSAVEHAATGVHLDADLQLLFVRFVDELTPTHFALLSVLAVNPDAIAEIESYEGLRDFFIAQTLIEPSKEEFRLFCNDLGSRVLVRFSDAIEDFGGIAQSELLATEASGRGTKVMVTELGNALLRFVQDEASTVAR